jgi:hypothetical protein
MPAPPTLIDQSTQRLKQFRRAVDFVQDHKPIFVGSEEQCRIGKLRAIFRGFQVEIKGWPLIGYALTESRLADLSRSNQSDGSLPLKGVSTSLRTLRSIILANYPWCG